MEFKEIYYGFDLGTTNIGYAVTDNNYKVLKIKRKRALGVRFFEEANTAVDRRTYRCARVRLQRRKQRIVLLQELFDEELMKKDTNFLMKLNENDLHREDSTNTNLKYSLFNDINFSDKQYYKKYPTIYHLRQELCNTATDDIRLLYLAIHHIIKYRGNFLINGDINDCKNPIPLFKELNEKLEERHNAINILDDDDLFSQKINDIEPLELSNIDRFIALINERIANKDKKLKAYSIFNASNSGQKKMIDTIYGGVVNVTTIFGEDKYPKETFKKFFLSDDFEQIEASLASVIDETDYNIICILKKIYDFQLLMKLLNGQDSLSYAMLATYSQHKKDLKNLKFIIEKYKPNKYGYMFDEPTTIEKNGKIKFDEKNNNYAKYISGGVFNGAKLGKTYNSDGKIIVDKTKISRNGRFGKKSCTKADFYKTVKSVIGNIKVGDEDKAVYQDIMLKIDDDSFMPKISSKVNSTIPYQLNMKELDNILTTAINSGKYSFLQKEEDGYTVAEKIKMLLKFRIPYYVGHVKEYLNDESRSQNSWAVRKQSGRVTPWNFKDMIDIEKSKIEFIQRMTTHCTYLKNEKTLPKKSVLFSKYVALNELNRMKVNSEPIDIELKKSIFNNVYLNKKINKKNIINEIKRLTGAKAVVLSGVDETLQADMDVYRSLKRVLGDKVDRYPNMIEKIIFDMTIFGDDSEMVYNAIYDEFVNNNGILTNNEANILKGFKFKGWSAFSQGLLAGSTVDSDKGIVLTDELGQRKDIIDILFDTNLNFMQITEDKRFNFKQAVQEYEIKNDIVINDIITYQDIDELYCSPSVKKLVWQAFEMTKELVKVTNSIPSKVFIEATRKDGNKNERKKSRKDFIENAYKNAKDINKEMRDEIDEYSKKLSETNNYVLNSEKIYLYFMQLGRCAYSNRPIDLDRLIDYDIEHIIPQAKVKDDSFNNIILVEGVLNKNKGDTYPVPNEYRAKGKVLWDKLHNLKLMSDDKYARLVRLTPISSEEQDKFINRQLVETSQSVLLVRDILERYFRGLCKENGIDKKVEIVLSKAANISEFRKNYGLTKSRDVNDFHHACDAYLNIVVGNALNEKFNHNRDYRDNIDSENKNTKSYNFKKALENSIYSYREKRVIYYPIDNPNATLNIINKEMSIPNYNVSKKIVQGKGEIYKATIFKAGESSTKGDDALYSRVEKFDKDGMFKPKSDTSKYGGYKHSGTAYFIVVDSFNKKGDKLRTIEAVPIYYANKIENKKLSMEYFLTDILKLKNPSLVKINGLNSSRLLVGSLLEFTFKNKNNGKHSNFKLRLAGIFDEGTRLSFHNANELIVDKETNDYVKELSLTLDKVNKDFKKQIGQDNVKKNKNETAEINNEILLEDDKKIEYSETVNNFDKDIDIDFDLQEDENILNFDLNQKSIQEQNETKKLKIFNELQQEKLERLKEKNQKSKIIQVTKERNLELYNLFVKKVGSENLPYKYLPGYTNFVITLNKGKDSFINMNEYAQLVVLLKLIKAFQCNAMGADTSDLPYGKKKQCNIAAPKYVNEGEKIKMALSKDIEITDISFISQSVTGLKEKRVSLTDGI